MASELFGEEAVLFKEKINFKLPGGGPFREHQDSPAWTFFNQSKHLTALVCLDDMTKENGALEFGDQQYVVHPHPGGVLDQEISKKLTWEMVETKAGDVVFFSDMVPHRSPPNLSDKPRRAMFLTYSLKSEGDFRQEYFRLKREEFPPEKERVRGKDYSSSKIDIRFNLANPID